MLISNLVCALFVAQKWACHMSCDWLISLKYFTLDVMQTSSCQRNTQCVPLPRHQGLGALDHLRRFGAFESYLGMGLSVDCTDENSTLWRPCFLLVQLEALKINTHPWLIINQVTPFSWPVDWSWWWVLSYSSYPIWWTLVAHSLPPSAPVVILSTTCTQS